MAKPQAYYDQQSTNNGVQYIFSAEARHLQIHNLSTSFSLDFNFDGSPNSWLHLPSSIGFIEFTWLFDPLKTNQSPSVWIRSTVQNSPCSFQLIGW